jgi:hypothetical protein
MEGWMGGWNGVRVVRVRCVRVFVVGGWIEHHNVDIRSVIVMLYKS